MYILKSHVPIVLHPFIPETHPKEGLVTSSAETDTNEQKVSIDQRQIEDQIMMESENIENEAKRNDKDDFSMDPIFNEIIEPLKNSSEVIILGDYNINLLNDDKYKNSFELCLQSNYLVPTILSPTGIATKTLHTGEQVTTKTLIDNIIIKPNTTHLSGLIESCITDHYPVYILSLIHISEPTRPY